MRKVLLSLSLFCAATSASMAMKVTGKVTDESGALPGASVMIKGTDEGVETDDNGDFTIEASQGQILVIEFLGYEPKEVKVTSAQLKKIVLGAAETDTIEEIVVKGTVYGVNAGVIGSSSSLGSETLKSAGGASVDNALQGRVSGVQASTTSGQPGAPAKISIHGTSTLNGSGAPLYVVDGMPLGGNGDKSASSNPIASINPADIESMEVLKDASATAIYGARASNGVIVITTKKGSKGQAKISYDGSFSVSEFTNRIKMMNLQEYATYLNGSQIIQDRQNTPDAYLANPSLLGKGTDWQDELFQTAIGHGHQLSVNGGDAKTQYNISLGYTNQEGIIITSNYERINGRMSVESQVKDWLRAGMNMGVARQKSTKIANIIDPNDNGTSVTSFKETDENIIVQTLLQLPSDSPYNLDGTVSGPETDLGVKMNPIAQLKQSPLEREELNVLGSTFLEFKLFKDITWRNEFGIDLTTASDSYNQPAYDYGTLKKSSDQATLDQGQYSNNSVRFSSYANYNHKFAKKHNIGLMAGAEANYYNWKGQKLQGKGFSQDAITTMNMASDVYLTGFYQGHGSMASFFGRVSYDYLGRYNFVATGRYDGSSNFADGNRWGFFPSVGLAWRASSEEFIAENDKLKNTITDLKLRLGYGETGNSNCEPGHISYMAKWNANNTAYDLYHAYNYTNTNLKWETNKQFNVGVNLSLWNRIDLTVDGFYKKNVDLLLKPELPGWLAPSDGGWTYVNTAYVNAGSIQNVGFDVTLHSVNVVDSFLHAPFQWDMDITFSKVNNEVLDLGSSTDALYDRASARGGYRMFATDIVINKSVKGEAPGRFYGYKTNGIIQNTAELEEYKKTTGRSANVGDVKYEKEMSFIGDPNPDFTYGFGTNVSWGPWSINVQLAGSQGNDVYNLIRQKLEAQNDRWVNQSADCLNYAQIVKNDAGEYVANPGTSMPRSEYTNDANDNAKATSDRYVEDGSYLKIQNIGVTYNLPSKYCQKIKVDNLHVSAGISNVYTFTGYTGYDPENPGSALRQGVDEGRYPSPRVYNVGLGFNF